MSGPFGSSQWMYASGGFYGYEIGQSARFNDDDSAYLSRTPASAGNRKTWTWSGWVKRGNLGVSVVRLFNANDAGSPYRQTSLRFDTDQLRFYSDATGVTTDVRSLAVYRDASAWYHIVVAVDTTQATASNRVRMYVNGSPITQFQASTYPSQNLDMYVNEARSHQIGSSVTSSQHFDGYLADVYFIDGQALDPTSFGETKSGIWIPKAYSGSYGTNGFHLEFAGNTNDTSGNGNNYTANNISAYDYVPDSPTSNFGTLSPLTAGSVGTLTQGSLQPGNGSSADAHGIAGTFGMPAGTGKWYWEVFINNPNVGDNYPYVGACAGQRLNSNSTYGTRGTDLKLNCGTGGVDTSTTYVGSITTVTTGLSRIEDNNILGVAVDMENRKMWFSENGVFPNSGNPATGANPTFTWTNDIDLFPHWFSYNTYGSGSVWNFGQDSSFVGNKVAQGNTDANGVGDFYYSPPSGFLAMCSANLPTPTIVDGSQHFNTVLYTGDGTSSKSVTGAGHTPDFLWFKKRSGAESHHLGDTIRGASKRLVSNTTAAETTESGLVSFDSDGFTISGASGGSTNDSGATYAAWSWKAGGTAVSNTDGSITSSVSANTDAGFSIVGYTGNGTVGATVGHGLNVQPKIIVIKNRDDGAQSWIVYHSLVDGSNDFLTLETTNASANSSLGLPTSSVFTVGGNSSNQSGSNHIAYCFHSVDGFSKAGSFVGNGSSDGPMIFTGFRPAFVMWKASSDASNWTIEDNARPGYNVTDKRLQPNNSNAEDSAVSLDLLSNGFKLRGAGANDSGYTWIYLAFAEQPFKYANAR